MAVKYIYLRGEDSFVPMIRSQHKRRLQLGEKVLSTLLLTCNGSNWTAGTRAARASAKFDSPMSVYQYKKIWWSMLARPAILARWSHQLPSSKYWINFESNLYTSTAPGACIGRWCDRSVRIRSRRQWQQRVVQSRIDHCTALLQQTSTLPALIYITTKNASEAASSSLNLFFCFLFFFFFSVFSVPILCSFLFFSVLFF